MNTEHILLLADTHGHLDPRLVELALRHDRVVHAGDIGGSGLLEALRPSSGRLYAVRGNNDTPRQWPADQASLIDALPEELELPLPGGVLWVEHGHRVNPASRRHERLRRRHVHARAIVLGHSHQLTCDHSARPWVLNPGAAGRSRTYGGPTCISLRVSERAWEVELLRYARNQDEVPIERERYTLETEV